MKSVVYIVKKNDGIERKVKQLSKQINQTLFAKNQDDNFRFDLSILKK